MLSRHAELPLSRRCFHPGHLTATALVLSPLTPVSLLTVHHRRLDRWLLPGGHIEPGDTSLCAAAAREVVEETGVTLLPGPPVLAGMDVHGIPPHKDEPYHLHHDLIFGFEAASPEVRVTEETRAVHWMAPHEFERYQLPWPARRAFERFCLERARA